MLESIIIIMLISSISRSSTFFTKNTPPAGPRSQYNSLLLQDKQVWAKYHTRPKERWRRWSSQNSVLHQTKCSKTVGYAPESTQSWGISRWQVIKLLSLTVELGNELGNALAHRCSSEQRSCCCHRPTLVTEYEVGIRVEYKAHPTLSIRIHVPCTICTRTNCLEIL